MAFKKPVVNTIACDMTDLSIYLRSIKKFGKSTLFRDYVIEKFKDPEYGLLVSVGKEVGDKLLDNLNRTHVNTYKEFVELKDWLIECKNEHKIKVVAFDTADELVPIFEKEVIRKYNVEEKPSKVHTSIKSVYGGYNRGVEMTADLIKDYMDDLMSNGFSVWVIAHTKYKSVKQKGDITEEGFMQLTSNLPANYEAAFGDIFDMTLTGIIDRNLETEEEEVAGKKIKKNYATDSIRKLYFRGTALIDAGSRFSANAVPEFLVFDEENMAKKFIETIEGGMEKSKTCNVKASSVKPKANKETPKVVVEEESIDEDEDEDDVPFDDIEDEVDVEDESDGFDFEEAVNKIMAKFKVADRDTKKLFARRLIRMGSAE